MLRSATNQAALVLATAFALGGVATGQPGGDPPASEPVADPDPAALLREGSYLLEVKGILRRSGGSGAEPGWWVFRIDAEDPSAGLYELTMLPCTLLASLEQLVEASPRTITFELTGQVFEYHGRNYLLPTHAPRLVEHVEPAHGDAEAAGGATSPQAILRDLDRRVGPVARSPRVETAPPPEPQRLVAPGTLLRWRRGWMTREPGGAWSYVFTADPTAGADPPMILMPCLLLEQMERLAQPGGVESPLLVSGRVYRYRGRNYLLPTMFQVPRNRTALWP